MSEIQFEFNPIPSSPVVNTKFPWAIILIALGLVIIIAQLTYKVGQAKSKSEEDYLSE